MALASCLWKGRAVLDDFAEIESITYADLYRKLELRFNERHSAQTYYLQFTNRKQGYGEELMALGTDIERLACYVYPECTPELQEKIACAQFISALMDGNIEAHPPA